MIFMNIYVPVKFIMLIELVTSNFAIATAPSFLIKLPRYLLVEIKNLYHIPDRLMLVRAELIERDLAISSTPVSCMLLSNMEYHKYLIIQFLSHT